MSDGSSGIGICGCLFLIFLVLKLIGVISWSWWWVFSPLWIPVCTVLVIAIFVVILFLIFEW